MSITVNHITKKYGVQKALDDISFQIDAGEIVGLLGPNGAGKSTLMKIISCFIPPTTGDVKVYGFDILEESIEVRKRIGYLPENNPLYLDMYVKEYLEFISGIHHLSDKKARISSMIETTGLGIEQNKKIGALSKGYRQRVGLAQVLIHDPDVLILDEPTTGLDPNQIIEIRELIRQIGEQKTIILSTHIMQEVEAICNRAIIINQGKIVADDQTKKLANINLVHEVVVVEFGEKVDSKKLRQVKGIEKIKSIDNKTWVIEAATGTDIRSDIFKFAVDNNYTVLSLNREKQNLEKVFQQLTQK